MAKTPDLTAAAPIQKKARSQIISQSEFPAYSLEEAIKIAKALFDNYAGTPEAPHNIAIAMEMNPTGSQWRMLTSAAFAYGITTGTYSAERIGLTQTGRAIVAPTTEGADADAIRAAVLAPRVPGAFYKRFDRNKLPKDQIASNILLELGIPQDKVEAYRDLLVQNGRFAGILKETSSGLFVALEGAKSPVTPSKIAAPAVGEEEDENELPEGLRHIVIPKTPSASTPATAVPTWDLPVSSVFISHGKNQKILDQVREIVAFGKFAPIVSKDRETVSKPVPDKVMDDMRGCQAAVIHVASEGTLVDTDGKPTHKINENVLIEIGAAMALYRRRFILLVEDGLSLPSNLQGLYEVRYIGDALDGAATMKLLKAFNDFSQAR